MAGVRSNDIAKELALKGPLKFGKARTLDGVRVEAIEGTQKFGKTTGRVVLYVRRAGAMSRWRRTRSEPTVTRARPST